MFKILTIVLLGTLISACDLKNNKYSRAEFPDEVNNFVTINSEFDDYNSTLPYFGSDFPICFSTNRQSNGNQFDIIFKLISMQFNRKNGEFTIEENDNGLMSVFIENVNLKTVAEKVRTPTDEFGPFAVFMGQKEGDNNINKRYNSHLFFHSSDVEGQHNIYISENVQQENYSDAVQVKFLNTEFDEQYPFLTEDKKELYFTSNREGNFAIYRAKISEPENIIDFLTASTEVEIEKMENIAADGNDKCPFIIGNTMVFASDRSGGMGGFDLYYSYLVNGEWQSPINFGSSVNSTADDFRPIVKSDPNFINNFLLFSSNRAGGLGGFDLYYVGIDKFDD